MSPPRYSFYISLEDNVATKCVYDERMFATHPHTKDTKELDLDTKDTEEEYLEIMRNMNDDKEKV